MTTNPRRGRADRNDEEPVAPRPAWVDKQLTAAHERDVTLRTKLNEALDWLDTHRGVDDDPAPDRLEEFPPHEPYEPPAEEEPPDDLFPGEGCLFGWYPGDGGSQEADERLAELVGRKPDISTSYLWISRPPTIKVHAGHRITAGVRAMLGLAWRDDAGNAIQATDVAAGLVDDVIRACAREVRDLVVPVPIAPDQEHDYRTRITRPDELHMKQHGTSADFIAAYRRVVQLFREEGATNARFGWWMASLAEDWRWDFYPGDDVVDWVSFDDYDWSRTEGEHGRERTAEQTWRASYDQAVARLPATMPILVTETGSQVGDVWGDPARAARWYRTVPAALRAMPRIKAFITFNSRVFAWSRSGDVVEVMRELGGDDWLNQRAA